MVQNSIECSVYMRREPWLFFYCPAFPLHLYGPKLVTFLYSWDKIQKFQLQLDFMLASWYPAFLVMRSFNVMSDSYKPKIMYFLWWLAQEFQHYHTYSLVGFLYLSAALEVKVLLWRMASLIGSMHCYWWLMFKHLLRVRTHGVDFQRRPFMESISF